MNVKRIVSSLTFALTAFVGGCTTVHSPDARVDGVPASSRSAASPVDPVLASSLVDLGLAVLRQHGRENVDAGLNASVSPLSLALALGMIHDGAAGTTRQEIAGVVASRASGGLLFEQLIPEMLRALGKTDAATKNDGLTLINRIWADERVAGSIPESYLEVIGTRYLSEGRLTDFTASENARRIINGWASESTGGKIASILPPNSIDGMTRLIVTNAVYFEQAWAEPFSSARSSARSFRTGRGDTVSVSAMQDTRMVSAGRFGAIQLYELPFRGEFSFLLALPTEDVRVDAFEALLSGSALLAWTKQLTPMACQLSVPRFDLKPSAQSMKSTLEKLGMQQAFSADADFGPMLGDASAGTRLSDIFQAAGVRIDETGGVGVAATAGAVEAKSFVPDAVPCVIDRPFVFVILHKPTGVPLFLGTVADPSVL